MPERDLTDQVISWVTERQRMKGAAHVEVTADTDLIATGLMDSLGFVDMLLFLEAQSGRKIDLTDVDPGVFSTVRGLCGIVLKNHDRASAYAATA